MTNALNIPGWKSESELKFAIELIKECKFYSTVVEIGAAAGRLTRVLSENAPYGSNIYAIDLWDNLRIFSGKGYFLDNQQRNTINYFLSFLQDRVNINVTPIIGDSLTIQWDKKIDLIVVDPDNGLEKTDLYKHLEKWYPYVKNNGIIVGYNFISSRPDMCEQIIFFAKKYNLNLEKNKVMGTWKFRKEN